MTAGVKPRVVFGPLQIAIGLSALSISTLHINAEGDAPFSVGGINFFYLVALGYMVLVGVRYLPLRALDPIRPVAWWLMVALTFSLITMWVAIGELTAEAYLSKIIEFFLLALLVVEYRTVGLYQPAAEA